MLWGLAAGAVLAVTVGIVYGGSIHAPFIFDDEDGILNNPSIMRLWPLVGDAEAPGPLNAPSQRCISGRPLVNITLALNYRMGGLDPMGYHLVNVLLHAGSAMLLFALVRRSLRLAYFAGRFEKAADPLALAVALLFALHPLGTEAVEYVTQRTELLMAFCYLATLYASLRYWQAGLRRARTAWLVIASLACLAGMASKEVMVTVPVMVFLFERTFVSGTVQQTIKSSWRLYLGLAVGWLLLVVLNLGGPRSASAGFHLDVPPYVWWFTQAKVFLLYLRLVVWPWPLVIHYEVPYLSTLASAWPYLLPVALMGLGTLWLLWRGTASGFLLCCVFLILAPRSWCPLSRKWPWNGACICRWRRLRRSWSWGAMQLRSGPHHARPTIARRWPSSSFPCSPWPCSSPSSAAKGCWRTRLRLESGRMRLARAEQRHGADEPRHRAQPALDNHTTRLSIWKRRRASSPMRSPGGTLPHRTTAWACGLWTGQSPTKPRRYSKPHFASIPTMPMHITRWLALLCSLAIRKARRNTMPPPSS